MFIACSVVCNRSWHLLGNPKLVWRAASLKKEGGFFNLSLDAMHLNGLLVLLRFEGSALFLPLFLLSPSINMLCRCSSTVTKDHHLQKLCVDVPLSPYYFIHS